MKENDLQAIYIDRLNAILPGVDFSKLDRSCNSEDDGYAKEVLKQMHDIFVEVYGTDYFDRYNSHTDEFIEFPAVIRGCNTGHISLGLVTLDLDSSAEHWGTFFFTPKGVIVQGAEKTPAQAKYLSSVYIPYDYWYTVTVERDHHVSFSNVPEKVAALLNHCYLDQPELKNGCQQESEPNLKQQNGPALG